MRIALLTCHFPPDSIGGAQVQSYRLCAALGKEHDVTVFARDYTGRMPRVEKVGTFTMSRRVALRIPVLRSIVDLITGLLIIRQTRKDFDIYLSFQLQLAATIAVMGALLFRIVGVVAPSGMEDFDFHPWYKRILQKFIYRYSSAILIQSEGIRKEFMRELSRNFRESSVRELSSKIHLFPNLILDPHVIDSQSALRKPTIIYVGRLVDYKGVEYLINAMHHVPSECELTIIGGGPDRRRLEKIAAGLAVRFVGEVPFDAVASHISSAWLLVLPSLTENLPNVILEALNLGLPVIATSIGAIPEIIRHGWNGYLVEPRNDKQIAECINFLLSDREKYQSMRAVAQESVRRFTESTLSPKLAEELMTIVAANVHIAHP